MIPNIHPNIKRLSPEFRNSDSIYIVDHMPESAELRISIKGVENYFQNTIIDLFNNDNIDWKNKSFLADSYLLFEDFENFKIDIDNNYFLLEAKNFLKYDIKDFSTNQVKYKFTFMSNKARHHRIFSSMIIANLFNTGDICYTYVKSPNEEIMSLELLIETGYDFDITRHLPEQHFYVDSKTEKSPWGGIINYAGTGNNATVYDFIYEKIYKNSTTSIITEPCFRDKGNTLSEKTAMAIYSGHFMIWPGAWRLPETVKKLGFDIFDDVIDHSYQYIEHPGKRVAEAFLRNIDFLNNIELQQKTREKMHSRLLSNIALIRDLPRLKENLTMLNINR